jgi:hypothetical protein
MSGSNTQLSDLLQTARVPTLAGHNLRLTHALGNPKAGQSIRQRESGMVTWKTPQIKAIFH